MRWMSVMRLATLLRSNVDYQLSPSGRSRESGAVASLVAILFGTGVLLGLGALVIDTGSLLYERRQLQSGADAAAMAIAQDCLAKDKLHTLCAAPVITNTPSPSPLVVLAGKNAADQRTDIVGVCGSAALVAVNGAFTVCPAPTPALVECPPVPSALSDAKYIEVRTGTRTATGTILPPFLAQALAGGTYSGETVKACTRVAWGKAAPPGPVLPVTFSPCAWKIAVGGDINNPVYQHPPAVGLVPGYGYNSPPNTEWPKTADPKAVPPIPESEVVLYNQGQDAPPDCTTWNNHVAPGTFGELTQTGCSATITDNWVKSENGNSQPCDLTVLAGYKGRVVYVPIFDCYTPTKGDFGTCNSKGPSDWYHIGGYAAFYLTGFYFSSGGKVGDSIYPGTANAQPCKNLGDRCISGWFTTGTLPTTIDTSDGPDFGTSAVEFAG